MNNPFEAIGLDHISASQCSLYASQPALWFMEKVLKLRSPVGAAAHRGIAVEDGVVAGLLDSAKSEQECADIASAKFRTLTALSRDPGREREGAAVPGMVINGLRELRPYGTPTKVQGKIGYEFDDLAVPLVGYYDVYWEQHGILVDIKTQLRLTSEIKTSHARQVSLYKAAISDNLDARICYVTDKKIATYGLDNYRDHLEALHKIALSIQLLLSLSDNPADLKGIFAPDVDSFYYNDPVARQNAFEVYGF